MYTVYDYDFMLIYYYVNATSVVQKFIACHFCHSNPDQNLVDKTNKFEYGKFQSAEKAIKLAPLDALSTLQLYGVPTQNYINNFRDVLLVLSRNFTMCLRNLPPGYI